MKRRTLKNVARAIVFIFVSASAHAGTTDLASAPLVTSSTSSVLPNLMLLLDDSGSMDSDYLPDWATTSNMAAFQNNDFNGVAYDPSVVYSPPVVYNADGSINTTTYKNMSSANSSAWTSVKNDGYGVQSSSSSNLVGNANFYTFVAGEYCSKPNLRNCVIQSAPTGSYPYPATLRWCTTDAMSACQALRIETGTTYLIPRSPPLAATATITVKDTNSITITVAAPSGATSTSVSGITASGVQIMKAATAGSTNTTNVASFIATSINNCMADTVICNPGGASDYVASSSTNVVTVTGTAIADTTVVVSASGGAKPLTFAVAYISPTTSTAVSAVTVPSYTRLDGTTTSSNNLLSGGTISVAAGTTAASTNINTVAANIAAKINVCHNNASCDDGYTATALNNVVTITAPLGISVTPTVSKTGSITFTATAFNGGTSGSNLLTSIVSGNNYPFPNTAAKATTRTDCAGATCTYAEEMTNYANWWAYYHTRMQMMKTSTSIAFQTVGSNNRVGYATINNNQGHAFVNPAAFTTANKIAWYSKLFAASPNNSTPLRNALAGMGRLYAGKYNGSTYNGVTVTDPMQYSCQQNFTILATDGYWNEASNPNQLDGSTDIGNQDSGQPRPFNDGGGSIITRSTPTTTVVRTQTVTNQNVTTVWSSFAYSLGALGADGCGATRRRVHSQEQRQTETKAQTITSVDDATATSTETVVTTNGVVTSDTTSNSNSSANVSSNTVATSDTFTAWANFGSDTTIGNCAASPSLPNPNPSTATSVSSNTANTAGPTTTPVSTTGPTVGATTTTTVLTGGTSNTLADVAEYYYATDLRDASLGNCTGSPIPPAVTGIDVCTDNVPSAGTGPTSDSASHQHMTLFTMALGASGYMQYSATYPTAGSGDYNDVATGNLASAASGVCIWQSDNTACNWPVPVSNTQTTIDDLWHAAVNGRGTYFSATNPASLNAGLSSALSGVSARTGSSAAATTSNPNVTSGDNFVFSSTFTSQEWDGEIMRQTLDLTNGNVLSNASSSTCAADWCAQALLDANVARTIYTFNSTAGNKLMLFNWANLSTAQRAYFTTPNISTLSQFCATGATCLSAANQTNAAGANLVAFLAGDRTNEGIATDITTYYRQRVHLLGDIVNAEAVYVKKPLFGYTDPGYSTPVTGYVNVVRQGMVYVAANDGMLHALNADTGAEAFAYVPSMVLPNLYQLADKNYSNLHQYFVDGTPVAGDVYFGGAWHTIVVGGQNDGGRGYYALDVTDPTAPAALWEFTDTNMGYTYGNPVITKLQDGTWVVLVTSGYNNVSPVSPGGDGVGRLYVINAGTGALIRTISTGVGNTTTPSGLARISAWVDNTTVDNTALRAYGGDMLGNLWRFDINGNIGAAGYDAQRLVTFYANAAGTVTQPITARPELGLVGTTPVVFVGTGRYLGVTDLTDVTQQTFYAVKDTLGTTTYANPKATGSNFVAQTETTTTCPPGSPASICGLGQTVRVSSNNTVNFATNNGWYVDLPDSGERDNTDPTLALGTLGFTTNVPNTDACTAGGYSYRYLLDYRTGAPVSTSTTGVSAIKLGNALSTRGVFVRLPNNTVVQLTRLSDGTTMTTNVPISTVCPPGTPACIRRVSWRELIQDQ